MALPPLTREQRQEFFLTSVGRLAEVLDAQVAPSELEKIADIFRKKLGVNPEALAHGLKKIS
jgi:hypothetical protein